MSPDMAPAAQRDAKVARLKELDELQTKRCAQSLAVFVQAAWHVLERNQALRWNWHLDLLCGELEDVSFGRATNDVAINQPPGTMKSLLLVFWNAWEWGPRQRAHLKFLCASHAQALASRDNQRVRDLVQSEWYQHRWPHVQLRDDENQKTRFGTTAGGWRIGTSVGAQAALGEHPHYKVIDDAHDPKGVPGDIEREAVWHWFTQTMSQRGHALQAVTVAVGQRLHEDDLFGRIRSRLSNWTHIVLPMRYIPPSLQRGVVHEVMPATPSGRRDARTAAGELLWPEYVTEEVLKKSEDVLGGPTSEGTSAQHQQTPLAPGGNMFKRDWFRVVPEMPADVLWWVRAWDVAGTEGGDGPRTAGVKMGRTASGRTIIDGGIIKGRWGPATVDQMITETAALDGRSVVIREEREGGSSGPAVIQMRALALPGYDYAGAGAYGSKETRATGLRTQAEAGNVWLVARTDAEREAVREFLDEIERFPRGRLKDQVDAAALGFNALVELAAQPREEPTEAGVWGGARRRAH